MIYLPLLVVTIIINIAVFYFSKKKYNRYIYYLLKNVITEKSNAFIDSTCDWFLDKMIEKKIQLL